MEIAYGNPIPETSSTLAPRSFDHRAWQIVGPARGVGLVLTTVPAHYYTTCVQFSREKSTHDETPFLEAIRRKA